MLSTKIDARSVRVRELASQPNIVSTQPRISHGEKNIRLQDEIPAAVDSDESMTLSASVRSPSSYLESKGKHVRNLKVIGAKSCFVTIC